MKITHSFSSVHVEIWFFNYKINTFGFLIIFFWKEKHKLINSKDVGYNQGGQCPNYDEQTVSQLP